MRRLFLVIVVSVLWVAGSHAGFAHALSSGSQRFVSADNTFYVYVKAGESISASFLRSTYDEVRDVPSTDITITVSRPGGKEKRCTIKSDIAVGKGCAFAPMVADMTGIWSISFVPAKGAKPYDEVSPDVRWQKHLFTWDVTVKGDGGEQHGRMWTERYAFRQPTSNQLPSVTGDFTYYYVSEDGYIYKNTDRQYNGQVSILLADSVGIRKTGECVSAYHSTEVSDKNFSPALGSCGAQYKLFFEEPAGQLPATAMRWDGKEDWVRPNISRPSLGELSFTSDKSSDQQSGTVSFFLHNFVGQYAIKFDVDNDGSFDGQSDVTLHEHMKNLSDGLQHVRFSGVDRQGQIIPPSQKIGVKVEIAKVAEIHFVAVDVEGRQGIQVTRLNGDNAPTDRVCWNDTELSPIPNARYATMDFDGRDCPASASGVHGWLYNNQSWGNARYIDDWIYATAKLQGSNQIVYPQDTALAAKKSQVNWLIILSVSFGVFFIGVLAIVILFLRRRRRALLVTPSLSTPGVESTGSQDPADESLSDQNRY